MMLKSFVILGFLSCLMFSYSLKVLEAQEGLSSEQLNRVKICKEHLRGIDEEPLDKTVARIIRTDFPEENLIILEAVSKTYAEILIENQVQGDANKRWLHGMIQLNMAYLQFGGGVPKGGKTRDLNQLICRKLRNHLPSELFTHRGIFHSLE